MVEEVEDCCLQAFTNLVVKLSEASFRPMFLKVGRHRFSHDDCLSIENLNIFPHQLFNWATHQSSPKERVITFYHLADRLEFNLCFSFSTLTQVNLVLRTEYMYSCSVAVKLKNLFLLFAGHIVKNAAFLLKTISDEAEGWCLDACVVHLNRIWCFMSFMLFMLVPGTTFFQDEDGNAVSDKGCLLLVYLLQCLRKCFLYDKGSFLSKERFETLLKPLVNQVG